MRWMLAAIAFRARRIRAPFQETAEPSKAIERAVASYRKLGRDEWWINDRMKAIVGNNEKPINGRSGVEGNL